MSNSEMIMVHAFLYPNRSKSAQFLMPHAWATSDRIPSDAVRLDLQPREVAAEIFEGKSHMLEGSF